MESRFEGRLVAKGAAINYPPRSPDLTVMDIWLFAHIKSKKKSYDCTVFEDYSKCRSWIFEFWHFPPIFDLLKLTYLVTLFDCKLQVFKNSPNWTIFGIFNELLSTQNVNVVRCAHNVEWDFFLWFSNTVPSGHTLFGLLSLIRCKLFDVSHFFLLISSILMTFCSLFLFLLMLMMSFCTSKQEKWLLTQKLQKKNLQSSIHSFSIVHYSSFFSPNI